MTAKPGETKKPRVYRSSEPPLWKAAWTKARIAVAAVVWALGQSKLPNPRNRGFKRLLEPWCKLTKHDWFKGTEGWRRCRRCWFTEHFGTPRVRRGERKLSEGHQFREGGYDVTGENKWVEVDGKGGHARQFVPNPDYVRAERPRGFRERLREERAARTYGCQPDCSIHAHGKPCPNPLTHQVDCKEEEPKA